MTRLTSMLRALVVLGLALAASTAFGPSEPATAQQSFQRISGEGSSWAANFVDAMRVDVSSLYGMTVDYNPSGSTSGRKNYLNGTVDFAASDIPFQFQPEDGSAPENPAPGSYVYIPVTAGGTAFMYNLRINGQQVTNLRLSGENVAKIFTGVITQWNDPALQADNPGITLPARAIVPVVRSDGSGSSAQFTMWMLNRHPQIWQDFCAKVGRQDACGFTSNYPIVAPTIGQQGDMGIAGYVSQSFAEGSIGYVNYSYAISVGQPVVKVLNAAGYYTEPTPENVAVSLLQADINRDESNPAVYLTQELEGVYTNTDPRNYELSSYSYFILPTREGGQFNAAKGYTLAEFARYAMCQGQQQSASLGYSPMPINLVQASFEQIGKIPGAVAENINIQTCENPTFSPSGENVLAATAPQPQACDHRDAVMCSSGTGGAVGDTPVTVVVIPPGGGGGNTGGGNTGGGNTGGDGSGGATGGDGSGGATGGDGSGGATGGDGSGGDTGQGGDGSAQGGGDTGDAGTGDSGQSAGGQNPGVNNNGGSNSGGSSGVTTTTAPCAMPTTATTTTVLTGSAPADPTTTTTSTTTPNNTTSPGASAPAASTTTTLPPCQPTTTIDRAQSGSGSTGTTPGGQVGVDVDDSACDPETGQGCVVEESVDDAGQEFGAPQATPLGATMPTTLQQRSRWGSSQTLIVLVSLLTIGLVLTPAVAWRKLSMRAVGA